MNDRVRLVNSGYSTTCGVLSGNVFLNVDRPTKILYLSLHFESVINEHVLRLSAIKTIKPKVIWETALLEAEGDSVITLPPGNHRFAFEIPLSGDLPDSLVSNFINVKYSLPGFGIGTTVHCSKRIHLHWTTVEDLDETDGVLLSNRWPKYLEYEVLLDTKLATFGQNYPVEFKWRPLGAEFAIVEVKSGILEKITSKNGNLERWMPLSNDIVYNSAADRRLRLQVHIPYRSKIFPDIKNRLIRVEHKLELRVIFKANCKLNSIRLTSELILLQPFDETEDQLPTYSQALLSPRLVLC
ncbi:hypothetical protein K493DRAFT_319028 [Basidiobolus meristosporus CBS 931.73]|uniref:Arrestin C-terminal-like domain-containing protein n=1 Tax=Basidiobolus meristosporus CBS 931.73 TaxID=1314790 RepID=A0A1Y1XTF9_9FUNG|nr:hypothetical protein K493DRAFT_319028 [Basidiobolus meristosporus CBS 931.73]|eukprot:ORX89020.1 hypothetical protein K493DRAFT_319028 [Basidiobolus meristosporus CBS 931.73]